ncbi:MAG: hypothetical protein UZ18_ATM001001243 [Armatimonadetes bacterium OLB18]|nr:MAG: hypothetical protein UZ18_ATM001001243 [Armatimonadetes bacterium OLB18]
MSLKNLAHLSGASAILALAILIGVAAVGFDLFWPEPAPAKSKLQRAKEEAELEASLKDLRGRQAQAKGLIATYAWEGDPRKVSADALASATEIAQECGVKLATFRPQRPGEAEGVVTLAYTMSLEGPFPNVHEFLRRLETKPSRLSVVGCNWRAPMGLRTKSTRPSRHERIKARSPSARPRGHWRTTKRPARELGVLRSSDKWHK